VRIDCTKVIGLSNVEICFVHGNIKLSCQFAVNRIKTFGFVEWIVTAKISLHGLRISIALTAQSLLLSLLIFGRQLGLAYDSPCKAICCT
jgi:hypothetical protein